MRRPRMEAPRVASARVVPKENSPKTQMRSGACSDEKAAEGHSTKSAKTARKLAFARYSSAFPSWALADGKSNSSDASNITAEATRISRIRARRFPPRRSRKRRRRQTLICTRAKRFCRASTSAPSLSARLKSTETPLVSGARVRPDRCPGIEFKVLKTNMLFRFRRQS